MLNESDMWYVSGDFLLPRIWYYIWFIWLAPAFIMIVNGLKRRKMSWLKGGVQKAYENYKNPLIFKKACIFYFTLLFLYIHFLFITVWAKTTTESKRPLFSPILLQVVLLVLWKHVLVILSIPSKLECSWLKMPLEMPRYVIYLSIDTLRY